MTPQAAAKELENVMRRVREAQSTIAAAIEPGTASGTGLARITVLTGHNTDTVPLTWKWSQGSALLVGPEGPAGPAHGPIHTQGRTGNGPAQNTGASADTLGIILMWELGSLIV